MKIFLKILCTIALLAGFFFAINKAIEYFYRTSGRRYIVIDEDSEHKY